jgi:uncharacterized protein YbbC (DUF1343 family)
MNLTKIYVLLLLAVVVLTSSVYGQEAAKPVMPGIEVLLQERLALLQNKRIGLITNPAGVDSRVESSVELLACHPKLRLVALYGPEHGVRGNAQAGEYVPFYMDDKYHLPVFSLYGQTMKPAVGMLKNIDEYMRTFDTEATDKTPRANMVEGVDAIVFDLQDVGTRVYTYIATMAYAMQSCAESDIEFIVLDRPNPLNGKDMEGPILQYPEFSSFVGLYPIPLRHAMTIGELALLFNDRYLPKKAKLTVVPMRNWQRRMWHSDTGLPWVMPSPNMPTLDTATVYPGQVFWEGTNLSEGRGTTRPFELIGAPWLDGYALAKKLNGLNLPGIVFREAWFSPTFSKFTGERCGGVQLHITDRRSYRSFATTLHIIETILAMAPDKLQFHAKYFDKIMGNSQAREALQKKTPVAEIVAGYREELRRFAELRQKYLLYE